MADDTIAPQAFEDAFKALSDLGEKPIPSNFLDPAPVVKDEAAQKAEAEAAAAKAKAEAEALAAKTALDAAAAEIIQTPEEKAAAVQTPEQKAEAAAVKARTDAEEARAAQAVEDDRLARFARAVRGDQQDDQRTRTAQPEPLFTADDAKFVAGFEKDWPDVARAMILQQKAMMRNIPDYVFRSIAAEFGPRLSMLEGLAERAQYQDLTGTVPDYDDIRDKVIEWAAKQPAYLQEPFNRVIQEGTVDEIADLIQRYRKDTGTAAPSTQQPLQAKPPAQDELSTTAKQAAAKLAPVSTKRSGAVTTAPQDFDGAFEAFSKAS